MTTPITDINRNSTANDCLEVLADEGFTLLNERPFMGHGGVAVGREWTLWHDELKLFGAFNTYRFAGNEKFNSLIVNGQFINSTDPQRAALSAVASGAEDPSGTVYVRREDLVDIAACSWNIQRGLRSFMRGLRTSGYAPTGAWVDAGFPTGRVPAEGLPEHILSVVNAGVSVLAISELAAHGR